jgi:hypothetical protein
MNQARPPKAQMMDSVIEYRLFCGTMADIGGVFWPLRYGKYQPISPWTAVENTDDGTCQTN